MKRLSQSVVGLTMGLATLTCVAQADPSEGVPTPQTISPPSDPAVAQELPEQPEPPEPPPLVADSEVQEHFEIGAGTPAGLLQFTQEMTQAGTLWIGSSPGNGGRPVLVYIPPNTDGALPFELVYHFHGTYSEVVAKQKREDQRKREYVGWDRLAQTLEAVDELQAERDYNVALVYPFSAGKRLEPGTRGWSNVAYDRMWMVPSPSPDANDDFDLLHAEIQALLTEELGVHPSKLQERVLIEGHSAGGIALRNIATHATPVAAEYLFLDASFQGWADGCYEATQGSDASARVTMVVTDKGLADPFLGRDPWCVDNEADAALWRRERGSCETLPAETEVADSGWTCEELEAVAADWKDIYAAWCQAFASDMQDLPEIRLIRTHIYHHDQPRRFSGGLGLDKAG